MLTGEAVEEICEIPPLSGVRTLFHKAPGDAARHVPHEAVAAVDEEVHRADRARLQPVERNLGVSLAGVFDPPAAIIPRTHWYGTRLTFRSLAVTPATSGVTPSGEQISADWGAIDARGRSCAGGVRSKSNPQPR